MAIKVLVVDDEPDVAVIFRQKFRRRLAAGEIAFQFAANGQLALDALTADPEISLVFTDIRMPLMDGLTFLREVRALERQVLLSLVVSAYDDMPNIREAMRQGAWDFVTKPIDLDELERVLDQALAEVRLRLDAIATTERLAAAQQAQADLQRSKELQREFFENVTHEFRTPLTLLLAPLESALGLSSEPEVIAYLRQAHRSGVLLLELINELLDVAKLDAQRAQPDWKSLDLSGLVADIANFFQPLSVQRGIDFRIDVAPGITGLSDRKFLGRILLNLLSNAFKFTPRDGRIEVALQLSGDRLQLWVRDTGKGISTNGNQNPFERFQQSPLEQSLPVPGTGLGLAICHAFATALGGSISLVKEADFSTSLLVELPFTKAGAGHLMDVETSDTILVSSLLASIMTDADEAPSETERTLVLIAEDHPDMRYYLQHLLQDDYDVVLAENGSIAWEKALNLIPDLILTDWMMPETDGIELLRRIRVSRDTQHIPVVMLTAKADLEARLSGFASGSEAFVAKPFHPAELKAVLRGLLQQRDRLRDRFRSELLHPDAHADVSQEDHFLADVKRVMEKHLMDEQFGVETMADALAMSRRTLVRKLTAVSGTAPVKFIRSYRLERAQQMLHANAAPVWEIAMKTGFGSASYFTKCYKEHFGMSPREAAHAD